MNVTDLRELLDDRSAEPGADLVSPTRLTDVRHRIVVRRRRRTVAAVAAAAVAVAAVSLTTVAAPRAFQPAPAGPPAVSPPPDLGGFPAYQDGALVVAVAVGKPGEAPVTLTMTPRSLDLKFFLRCPDQPRLEHSLTVNGRQVAGGTGCGGVSLPLGSTTLADSYGVRVGQPMTVDLTAEGPASGTFAIAVGERVDPATYPYPPRPATLAPLQRVPAAVQGPDGTVGEGVLVGADRANPNQPVQVTVKWPAGAALNTVAQTPGALRISVDGVQVGHEEWWDYEQHTRGGLESGYWKGQYGLEIKNGQRVTVTVTPERMTGDWQVLLQPVESSVSPD